MKCKRCVWGTRLTPKKVYCLFPSCVKDKNKKVIDNANKTKEAVPPTRLSRANRQKVLPHSPKEARAR